MYKQAFLILTYKKSKSLKDLLTVLSQTKGDVFVHIDRKCQDRSFIKMIESFSNTKIIDQHYDISWGSFNMVKAMLALLRNACSTSTSYSHYVFLSGSDYPVWNSKEIVDFFHKNYGKELINAYDITTNDCLHCKSKIINYFYMEDSGMFHVFSKGLNVILSELFRIREKKPYLVIDNKKEDVFYGSQWFGITEDCARYVLKRVQNKEYAKYFKHAFAPDEMFFHTIIFNSKFKNKNQNRGIKPYSPKWNLYNYTYLNSSRLNCSEPIEPSRLRKKINKILGKTPEEKEKFGSGSIDFLNKLDYESIEHSKMPFCRKVDDTYSRKLILRLRLKNGLTQKLSN